MMTHHVDSLKPDRVQFNILLPIINIHIFQTLFLQIVALHENCCKISCNESMVNSRNQLQPNHQCLVHQPVFLPIEIEFSEFQIFLGRKSSPIPKVILIKLA